MADGFFEWDRSQGKGAKSIPYYFKMADGSPFAFAGLWECWTNPENEEIESCVIITCEANSLIASMHHRMPVILDKKNMWLWLNQVEKEYLQEMLTPYPSELMDGYSVSRIVNNPKNDTVECVALLSK